jgi:hypothetical protein
MKIHNIIASCLAGHTDTDKELSTGAQELLEDCFEDMRGPVFDGHTHIAGLGTHKEYL